MKNKGVPEMLMGYLERLGAVVLGLLEKIGDVMLLPR